MTRWDGHTATFPSHGKLNGEVVFAPGAHGGSKGGGAVLLPWRSPWHGGVDGKNGSFPLFCAPPPNTERPRCLASAATALLLLLPPRMLILQDVHPSPPFGEGPGGGLPAV